MPSSLVISTPSIAYSSLHWPWRCCNRAAAPATLRFCRLFAQLRRHAPVGLAKREAFGHDQAVGFLRRVNAGIEPDRGAAELERRDGGWQDVECRERQVDAAKQRKLQQLQVALITRGKLGAHGERLEQAGLRGGGAAANELENVRVLLLRHDRGAGGEGLRQHDEAEFPG